MSAEPTTPALSPLRLWPALVLVALLWILRNVPLMVTELTPTVFMVAFFGPAVGARSSSAPASSWPCCWSAPSCRIRP